MNALWSAAKTKVSNRLAAHFRVESFRLRNEAPMVSFTFDDIPKSAATTGAGILEDHGGRGTFYVSGGRVSTTSSPHWAAADRAKRPIPPGGGSRDQDRELRLPLRLRVILAQAAAQGSVPVLPRYRAWREQRHRGPAIPPRDALDRPAHRSRRDRARARRNATQ